MASPADRTTRKCLYIVAILSTNLPFSAHRPSTIRCSHDESPRKSTTSSEASLEDAFYRSAHDVKSTDALGHGNKKQSRLTMGEIYDRSQHHEGFALAATNPFHKSFVSSLKWTNYHCQYDSIISLLHLFLVTLLGGLDKRKVRSRNIALTILGSTNQRKEIV
jgi:hypothetical protein